MPAATGLRLAARAPVVTLDPMRRTLLLAAIILAAPLLVACHGRAPGPKPAIHAPGHLKPTPGHVKRVF